jgi:peptidyl-Lys metalloendopeptidase
MVGKRRSAGLAMAAAAWAMAMAMAMMPAHAQAADGGKPGVSISVKPERAALGKSDEVAVVVTMTNTSAATVYLLAWQTPFGAVEAPLFDITRDGQPVRYLGRMVKRAAPVPADTIALAPGASRSVRVELSALYQMGVTGAYGIRYRDALLQLFDQPGAGPAAARGFAAQAPAPAPVWIDGRLARGMADPAPAPQGGPGLSFSQCTNPQQQAITGAAQAAQAMAADGEAYLQTAAGARYTSWFGAVDATRTATVARHFTAIRDAFATRPVTVDCGCTEDYYAYVYPDQPYKIHVCNAFWSAPPTGTDSKGGTLVHEMSHFTVVAGTDDWAYGQEAAAALAAGNPARAIDNADSHEYFGENTPRQSLR